MWQEFDQPDVRRVEALFNAALALSTDLRSEYLSQTCGDDTSLRRRVEALLRAHDAPEGFLPEEPGPLD